jgi:stearoyl-CoA desaturase (delta-9 desaturase)
MKVYNAIGYALILVYALVCMAVAPPALGPWGGLLVCAVYFVVMWVMGGVYLSCVIHMGIAHRALDYRPWFIKAITLVNNAFGVYIGPVTWVNRHRLHHRYSDHAGDPNKLASDGLWRTLWLCLFPYETRDNVATDAIFKTFAFRLVSNPVSPIAATALQLWLLAWLTGSWVYAVAMWTLFRVFALWINMIQNYWTHDRRYGYRRHDDERDNAMNIGEWLPVTITFSACLQNNHHHSPGLLRLSHSDAEYDFGFLAVKAMKALGLVRATRTGLEIPKDVPLGSVGF